MKIAENKSSKRQGNSFLDVLLSSFKQQDYAITDILPYKRTTEDGYLVDSEDNYQAFLKIKTTDLVSMNETDSKNFIYQLTNICRVTTENLKVLAMTYSTETVEQQVFWKKKINQYRRTISLNVDDAKRYETMLKLAIDNYRRVSWVEENLSELTFFFVVYGKSEKELKSRIKDLIRYSGKTFSPKQMNREQLDNICFRLMNLNTDL